MDYNHILVTLAIISGLALILTILKQTDLIEGAAGSRGALIQLFAKGAQDLHLTGFNSYYPYLAWRSFPYYAYSHRYLLHPYRHWVRKRGWPLPWNQTAYTGVKQFFDG